jgi:hypothetical protein
METNYSMLNLFHAVARHAGTPVRVLVGMA